jgi:hypothetical protein
MHTTMGLFLGYTATDKNIMYIDTQMHRIKTTMHYTYDKNATTVPPVLQSPAQKALQHLRYASKTSQGSLSEDTCAQHNIVHITPPDALQVQLL